MSNWADMSCQHTGKLVSLINEPESTPKTCSCGEIHPMHEGSQSTHKGAQSSHNGAAAMRLHLQQIQFDATQSVSSLSPVPPSPPLGCPLPFMARESSNRTTTNPTCQILLTDYYSLITTH